MVYQLLIVILLILWIIDGYFTINNFKKYGPNIEKNPILKQLLRHNIKYFLLFKIVDAIAFAIIIYLIINKSELVATSLLLTFILIYIYVNFRNYQVFKGM